MASRSRNYRASAAPSRASVTATPGSSRTGQLPEYRKPQYPLNEKAQRDLQRLHASNDLQTHNKRAVKVITDAAGSINDHLREHEQRVERRRNTKWAKGERLEEQGEQERGLEELQNDVNEMTKKLEESMRSVIDASEAAQRIEETLAWVRENAPKQMHAEYDTQRSQRRSQNGAQREGDADEDMEEDEGPTPGPTPLTQQHAALTGVSPLFNDRLDRSKNQYSLLSHSTRYAKHNDYVGFKAIVHDAKYGDDIPLPHADTWFNERGSPAPGVTALDRDAEEDDDLVIDKAKVSLKCPITLGQFRQPFTSRKCPHSFEKDAITNMIRYSEIRFAGKGPKGEEKAVQCPVTGCDQNLRLSDLYEDPILKRKIKRMQEAEQQAQEESEEDEEGDTTIPATQIPASTAQTDIMDLGSGSEEDE